MVKKKNLFLLIKSLTKAEKRYFRLFAGQTGSLNYIKLFDVIDNQVEYDEKQIKQKFGSCNVIRKILNRY